MHENKGLRRGGQRQYASWLHWPGETVDQRDVPGVRLHVGQAVTVLVTPAFRAIAFEDAVVNVCDDELAGTLAGSAVNTLDAVVPVADEFKAADTYQDGRWCGCCAGYVLRLHVASVWGFGGETHRSPFTRREGADGDRQNPGFRLPGAFQNEDRNESFFLWDLHPGFSCHDNGPDGKDDQKTEKVLKNAFP